MKKYRLLSGVLLSFLGFASTISAQKNYYFYDDGKVIYQIPFADVDSITLDPIVEFAVDNITLFNNNDSCKLDLIVEPAKYIGYSDITWTSSNEDVALIKNGYVIPVSEGEAVLNGTYRSRLVTCTVKVIKAIESTYKVPENMDQFVDLGLPSGTLWAKCNVGVSKPEELGDFYAWGELEPKKEYTYKTYRLPLRYESDTEYSSICDNNEIYSVYDVCTQKLGKEFCLPNRDQIKELISCKNRWDTLNGVEGQRVIGPNGNSIFLPAGILPGTSNIEANYLSSRARTALNSKKANPVLRSDINYVHEPMLARPVYREMNIEDIKLTHKKIEFCLGSSPVSLRLNPTKEHIGESDLLWYSSNNDVATVTDGIVTPGAPGHCVVVCAYKDLRAYCEVVVANHKDTYSVITHEYVDLGLPSGNLWATTNIGSSTPIEYGHHFAWGNVTPYPTHTCDYCGNMWWGLSVSELMDRNIITKDSVLSPLYDAANYNWGEEWSVPSKADFDELINNCEIKYTFEGKIDIVKFIGPNGNELIIPNAGLMNEPSRNVPCRYWTSSPSDNGNSFILYSWDRGTYSKEETKITTAKRGSLIRIRPVMKPNKK